ncbi:hypothetical protein CW711_02320 [Candidatus Bathyarchaeota archaeon]|nr:MAG: hypothetical protein CW711_02320 [Candidatus Bathyarchaeota archaeon]
MFIGGKTMEKRRDAYIGVRVPRTLKELIQKVVERDTHLNEADFVRDAIREKIQRDAPDLKQLFQGGNEA